MLLPKFLFVVVVVVASFANALLLQPTVRPVATTGSSTRLFAAESIDFQQVVTPLAFALATAILSYQVDQDAEFVSRLFQFQVEDEAGTAEVVEITSQAMMEEQAEPVLSMIENSSEEEEDQQGVVKKAGRFVQFVAFPWLPLLRPSSWRGGGTPAI